RLKSRPWYSETLAIVTDPDYEPDLASMRSMLEHFIKPNPREVFVAKWGHTRVFGRSRFLLVDGVMWWGLTAGVCLGLGFGYGLKAQFSLVRCVLGVIAGLALGYGVGALRWARAERQFKNLMWKQKQPAKSKTPLI